jgi:phosphoenolpyruvate synthase/pyruvate phosphate dikinase
LDDARIRPPAHLAHVLEATHGWPVDLECAHQRSRLYLLQCRPITTLSNAESLIR